MAQNTTSSTQVEAQSAAPAAQIAANTPAPAPRSVSPTATPTVEVQNYQVNVKAPADKGMLAYLVGPGAQIILTDIDINTATVAQEGGNLRITTASGGEILLLDFTASAADPSTTVVTSEGSIPAQQLLKAVSETEVAQKLADVEPAAGQVVTGDQGGITPPTIMGTGVGSGFGIFSSVIGPYGLPIPHDEIKTEEHQIEYGRDTLLIPGPGNLPPVAHNDLFSTAINTPINLTPGQLMANDSDPEGDPLSLVSVQGALHGTVQIVGGNVVFTPDNDFTGTASFSYTITDGHGGISTADVLIQIDPTFPGQNTVIAADDAYTVPLAGQTINMNVLANDSDPEGDALVPGSVRIITGPSVGTATANADGTITYQSVDSNTDYFVTLVYEVFDDRGAADTATVTIEVKANINSVDAIDDTGEIIPAGASKIFNVVANDIDPQGDDFEITAIVTGPTRGSATFDAATGTITYHSVAGLDYTDTITYQITDEFGATDTAVLTVNVAQVNNVVAADDTADLRAGQDVRIDVLHNDSDAQGDSFSVTGITEQPRDASGNPRGSVAINADGTITYTDTPGARDAGVVEFKYEITDARGATDTAVVRVTIDTGLNGVDANNDTITLSTTAGPTNITAQMLANDFDPQNDTFSITALGPITVGQGTVTLAGGVVTFTPAAGYEGPVVFTYTITDALGAQDTAQVTINMQEPANTDLNAGDDTFVTPFNTNLTITPAQLLSNDFDPQGGTITITGFTQPSHGTVTLAGGNYVYNPNDTFRGTDSFTYTITDDQGDVDTAVVTIRVDDPNSQDNPVDAVDDAVNLQVRETRFFNVLNNDSAPDGGLTYLGVVGALPAGVVDLGGGNFRYTAGPDAAGTVLTFQYEVRDVDGDTDTATVTITVQGPDNTIDAVNDAATTRENTPVTINVLANDVDPEGDSFSVTSHTQPANGTVVDNGDGTFTYTPNTGFNGTDTFTYTITDALGATDTATVTVTVQDNTVDAVNDTTTTNENTPVTINVLANDVDPEGDSFSVTSHTQPANGTVVNNGNGTFTYTPNTGFSGTDTFTYTITDALGATDTATVTVTVQEDNNTVDARNDAYNTTQATPISFNVLANDVDPQGDSFSLTSNTNPSHGTLTYQGNGVFTYTPYWFFTGTDTFTYTITDEFGATDTATVSISVQAPPPPPPGGEGGEGGEGGGDGCPLVIDLDNDGIELLPLAQSNAFFNLDADVNADGFAEHTAWYGAREGIVARDYNGNGTIDDVTEVFGGTNLDGFTELRMLEDSNHDGIVDAQDSGWNDLRIWVDANSDGVSQAGELHTMDELGIKSIDTNGQATHIGYEDAYISHTGTVHMTDGSTRESASVFFTNEGTGVMQGTSGADTMIYSSTADSIDAGQGFDTLKVLTASEIVIGHDVELHGVERIDLGNGQADKLSLNVNDILGITDHGLLVVEGDAVDQVNLSGDYTQQANTTQPNGTTYASYVGSNGAQLLVELGVQVHTDPNHHG